MDLNVKIDDSEFNISNNVDDKEEIEITYLGNKSILIINEY